MRKEMSTIEKLVFSLNRIGEVKNQELTKEIGFLKIRKAVKKLVDNLFNKKSILLPQIRGNYMKIFLITFFTFLMLTNSFGQRVEKIYLNENDRTISRYLTVLPKKIPYKGYMLLIPSFYESPEHVMEQTDLPILAAKQGILTIIPTFKTGIASFGIDSLTQLSFKEILEDVHNRYNLTNLNFYLGGFSIGGSCAVKFAEDAVKDNYQYQPDAIFVVDPPLDFIRFYNSMKRTLRIAPDSKLAKENIYLIQRIEFEMQGSPTTAFDTYIEKSPYCFSDTNQTAIKHIINIPIRYYTEPELDWKMKDFGSADYSDLNALDGSCMINELLLLGNKNAELILTKNKGYRRPNHRKQPHSWSIIDEDELIQWLQSLK